MSIGKSCHSNLIIEIANISLLEKISEKVSFAKTIREKMLENIRRKNLDLSPHQMLILFSEILENVFGKDLAASANAIAIAEWTNDVNLGDLLFDLQGVLNTLEPSDFTSLAIIQAKVDLVHVEMAKTREIQQQDSLSRLELLHEQEKAEKISTQIDNRKLERDRLNSQITQFIKDYIQFPAELSRTELAEYRAATFSKQPISRSLAEKLAEIERGKQLMNGTLPINMDKDVFEYYRSQNSYIQIEIPNVPFIIGASMDEAVIDNFTHFVTVPIYLSVGDKVVKLMYPLRENLK